VCIGRRPGLIKGLRGGRGREMRRISPASLFLRLRRGSAEAKDFSMPTLTSPAWRWSWRKPWAPLRPSGPQWGVRELPHISLLPSRLNLANEGTAMILWPSSYQNTQQWMPLHSWHQLLTLKSEFSDSLSMNSFHSSDEFNGDAQRRQK